MQKHKKYQGRGAPCRGRRVACSVTCVLQASPLAGSESESGCGVCFSGSSARWLQLLCQRVGCLSYVAASSLCFDLSFPFCFVLAIMTGRTWTAKFATKHRFGSRKRKPPNIRKISRPNGNVSVHEPPSETVDVLPNNLQAVTALCSSGDHIEQMSAF